MEWKLESEIKGQSGIYKIVNIENHKYYIGRAVCLRRRYLRHCNNLSKRKHRNKYLEREYWKYGKHVFEFHVLKFVDKALLIETEQQYLDDIVSQNQTYNLTTYAVGPGNCLTEEGRKKISQTLKGRPHSKERIQKIIKSCSWRKKKATLVSPNNELVEINGIAEFCRKHKLNRQSLGQVINGKIIYYRAWRLPKNRNLDLTYKIMNKNIFKGLLISPTGQEIKIIRNRKKFAKENNLSYSRFCQLLLGKIPSYKGWYVKNLYTGTVR